MTSKDIEKSLYPDLNEKLDRLKAASDTIATGAKEFLWMEYTYLGVFTIFMALIIMVSGIREW